MRKAQTIAAILFLLFIVSCNKTGNEAAKPVNAEGYIITDYSDAGGLQKAVKKDQQSKVIEEGDLLKGLKEGTWVTYHANSGLVATVTGYRNGKKHGLSLKGDETGSITEKMFFINDQLEGQRLVYNRTHIKEEANYKNGKLEGERKLYYDNGKIQEEGTFKNGKRDGSAKWYDQEGKATIEYTYRNGEKQ